MTDSRIASVAATLYRRGGFKAFYRGLGTTLIRAFPVNAATFAAYELAMSVLSSDVAPIISPSPEPAL